MNKIIKDYKAVERYARNSQYYQNGHFYSISFLPIITVRNMKKNGITIICIETIEGCSAGIKWKLPDYINEIQKKKFIQRTLEARLIKGEQRRIIEESNESRRPKLRRVK